MGRYGMVNHNILAGIANMNNNIGKFLNSLVGIISLIVVTILFTLAIRMLAEGRI